MRLTRLVVLAGGPQVAPLKIHVISGINSLFKYPIIVSLVGENSRCAPQQKQRDNQSNLRVNTSLVFLTRLK
jgi:hypothetical protein